MFFLTVHYSGMCPLENHTRGVVFEKQKPSELSAIKCLFRLSISDIFRLLAGILY